MNWCVKHNIGQIVVGKNQYWKQNINIGKRNNQNFVLIPFDTIIQKLSYKLEEVGITLKEQEESHTSICSFLDNELIEHHEKYVGKRIIRSLFKSAKGIIIHDDVNAGYNIIRKAIPKFSVGLLKDGGGGCALHPLRYSITNKEIIDKTKYLFN